MISPFPGMDPFLELRWQDVHTSLMTYIRDQLQEQLPADLLARMNERVVMEFTDDEPAPRDPHASGRPDVGIMESSGGIAVAAPPMIDRELAVPSGIMIREFEFPETEPFIEIVDAQTGARIITIIELVSPTNGQSGSGRDSYLAKQKSTLKAKVNLIEIDLTRAGDRAAIMPWCRELPLPWPAYLAGVHRKFGLKSPQLEYHELPMEAPLKPIAIPLRPTDADVILKLQPLIEQAYQRGRYYNIDYKTKLKPPLSYAEQALLDQRLEQRR